MDLGTRKGSTNNVQLSVFPRMIGCSGWKAPQAPDTEDTLEVVKVVAESGLDHVSNATDQSFLAGDNIANLDDRRRILGKECRFDEAVLEQKSNPCRSSKESNRHTWNGL